MDGRTDRPNDGLADQTTDRPIDRPNDGPTDEPTDWLAENTDVKNAKSADPVEVHIVSIWSLLIVKIGDYFNSKHNMKTTQSVNTLNKDIKTNEAYKSIKQIVCYQCSSVYIFIHITEHSTLH